MTTTITPPAASAGLVDHCPVWCQRHTPVQTYLWNPRLATAGIVDVGHLEVALRNAYDRQLTAGPRKAEVV